MEETKALRIPNGVDFVMRSQLHGEEVAEIKSGCCRKCKKLVANGGMEFWGIGYSMGWLEAHKYLRPRVNQALTNGPMNEVEQRLQEAFDESKGNSTSQEDS